MLRITLIVTGMIAGSVLGSSPDTMVTLAVHTPELMVSLTVAVAVILPGAVPSVGSRDSQDASLEAKKVASSSESEVTTSPESGSATSSEPESGTGPPTTEILKA